VKLIRDGKAYVCELTKEEAAEYKGDFYTPGRNSPYRDRPVAENLELFERMQNGEIDEGAMVLRAKIDMNAPNMNLRDPPMVRVLKRSHHRTGDRWCIYPTYDWTHGQSDAFEGITHSLCTLEFEDHRPLYDWFLDQLDLPARPRQIEFARLNLTYTVLSKRRLSELVRDGLVSGWNDPRMPTLSGIRRRGYPPEAVRRFCERVGIAKSEGVVDVALLEHAVRERLNDTAPRVMAVLDPLKVVITNFPEGEVEEFDAPYHPEDPSFGTRKIPLSREIYVERDDFREVPPRKWHRLAPGAEIRLRYACLIRCHDVIKNDAGEVTELHCTWDPLSRGGTAPDGRRVRGTSHWVSAAHAVPAEVRLYDRLFTVENPMAAKVARFTDTLNPSSLEVRNGLLEPSLVTAEPGSRWQFERLGYFCVDTVDSRPGAPVFNRTVTLRDSWAKIERGQRQEG
jgi:glutaminyl-tRNA synthetase